MTDDMEIIHSPLAQTYSAGGHTLRIHIYRSADSLLTHANGRSTCATKWAAMSLAPAAVAVARSLRSAAVRRRSCIDPIQIPTSP